MTTKKQTYWFSPKGLAALGLIGAVSYFLLMEHRQHVFEYLPFLILLLCPLMHVFMHRGHGKHGSHNADEKGEVDHDAYQRGLEEGRKQSESHHPHN